MAIRTIKTCDVTGVELPDDTRADRLTWGDKSYDLYLSNEGHTKIAEFLDPILEHAEEVRTRVAPTPRKTASTRRTDLDDIRTWARGKGYEVADRGRIAQKIIDEYDAQK